MKTLAQNKPVRHNYDILETYEAGLVLTGSEVKAAKSGHISLKGSFAKFISGELFLINAHIGPYKFTSPDKQHDPLRNRKLLLNSHEISALLGKIKQKNLTLAALSVYNKKGRIKVALGLARGRKKFDKREVIKKRDIDREIKRSIKYI